MPNPKYRITSNGNTYGTRKKPFVTLYVPALKDAEVTTFLLAMRAKGENITQLITDAIKLLMASRGQS